MFPAPFRGEKIIFPVVFPPKVRLLFNNDWMVEVAALREKPFPVPADRVAVGVLLPIPVTAKRAELVPVPPIRRSMVEFPGYNAPRFEFQKLPPLLVGRIPVTSVDAKSTAEEERAPEELR